MKLQIRVNSDDKIEDVKFKTFGCGSAIASSSYLTELVRGMTLEEAGRVRNTEIAKELCLPPVKCEFSVLSVLSLFRGYGVKERIEANCVYQCIAQCWRKMRSNLLLGTSIRRTRTRGRPIWVVLRQLVI